MKVNGLLWAFLGLAPLAASLNVDQYLSEEFLASLPEKIQNLSRAIKNLLNEHPCLHFDRPENWGPPGVELATTKYIPALTDLMAEAIGDASFVLNARQPFDFTFSFEPSAPSWYNGLYGVLEYLTGGYERDLAQNRDRAAAQTVKTPYDMDLIAMQEALSDLSKLFAEFVDGSLLSGGRFSDPHLVAEAATLGPRLKIQLRTKSAERLWAEIQALADVWEEPGWRFGTDRDSHYRACHERLTHMTEELGPLFANLRLAAKELVDTKCFNSWVVRRLPWEDLFPSSDYSHWPEVLRHEPTANIPGSEREAVVEALHRFGARLLSETIALRLETASLVAKPLDEQILDGDQLSLQLSSLAKAIDPVVGEIVRLIQALNEQQELTVGALADFITETIPSQLREQLNLIRKTLDSMLTAVTAFQAGHVDGVPKLKVESATCLMAAYLVARRLVESFATILTLIERECPEGVQKDLFLTTLDAVSRFGSHLVLAKALMGCVEGILGCELGPEAAPYEWNSFPILNWSPLPQAPVKRANA